ncbi:MAG: pirin family protein [Thermoplasmata archaeon]|nr:pirin family protein [Thermoplasmata archaeon]
MTTSTIRNVSTVLDGTDTLEGAGVRLRRAFGHDIVPRLDPFLLMDHFRSRNPLDYTAGFPWHPHRGIETVTYMLDGSVDHEDSLGHEGSIAPGDIQWMTSGSGILHQEMPRRTEGLLEGFQLWVNMPARAKMSQPAYRGVPSHHIPAVRTDDGASIRVVAGTLGDQKGPVQNEAVDPTYWDVTLPAGAPFEAPTPPGHTVLAYTVGGRVESESPEASTAVGARRTILFGDGDAVQLRAGPDGGRFLFVMGRPLREPVAWWGPIVMNSDAQLREAITELRRGDFIKHGAPVDESL